MNIEVGTVSTSFDKRQLRVKLFTILVLQFCLVYATSGFTDSFSEAFENGTVSGNLRLRHESVDQDSNPEKASALTLRTKLNFTTAEVSGLSAVIEFEDSRVVGGEDDYNNTLGQGAIYPVVADPETTELDQGFVKYKSGKFSSKLGRQVITVGNHRFVGHVGWRQDRQTFDAATVSFEPVEKLKLDLAFIDQRNRIFAEGKDIDSSDQLINVSYKLPLAKLSAYALNLENEATDATLDTTGFSLAGSYVASDTKLLYMLELASQSSESATTDFDADYQFVEIGAVISDVTAKFGYEVLGSDNGAYGFSTPLATLHKFNGWADQFLGTPTTGLVDAYLSLSGKVSGIGLALIYHDFSADESSATVDDLGSEIDFVAKKKFAGKYASGIKYAAFSGGDASTDTDKVWLWTSMSF